MAIVYGPFHGDNARGKFAQSLVFIGWKGIKTVRQWVIPANPKSGKQGNVRTILGGIGRACGKVVKEMDFHEQMKTLDVIPDKQSKQSYLVKYIREQYLAGAGATLTAAFVAMLAEITGHAASPAWGTAADNLEITAFSLTYDNISDFDKRLGIYLIAKAAIALNFTGTPYTLSLATWTAIQINDMAADFTALA